MIMGHFQIKYLQISPVIELINHKLIRIDI